MPCEPSRSSPTKAAWPTPSTRSADHTSSSGLTDEIEKQATACIEEVDKLGGALKAIEQGFIQRQIADASYKYQLAVESGDQVVVGVNRFETAGAGVTDTLRGGA